MVALMGLTDKHAAIRDAGLNPVADAIPTEPAKPRGHGRRNQRETLHNPGGSPELRGIPLVGAGPGAITRPGIDTAASLDQAGRDILRANLHRNRFKPSE
jgi:hypothetical protein